MNMHVTKILAVSAFQDGVQYGSVKEWATNLVEELHFDDIAAHM